MQTQSGSNNIQVGGDLYISFKTQYKPLMVAMVLPNFKELSLRLWKFVIILAFSFMLLDKNIIGDNKILALFLTAVFSVSFVLFLNMIFFRQDKKIPLYVYKEGFIFGFIPTIVEFSELIETPRRGSGSERFKKLLSYFPKGFQLEHRIKLQYKRPGDYDITKLDIAFDSKTNADIFIEKYTDYKREFEARQEQR